MTKFELRRGKLSPGGHMTRGALALLAIVIAVFATSAQQPRQMEGTLPRPGDRPAAYIHATRSVVMARNGMIATTQPLASTAGFSRLHRLGQTSAPAPTPPAPPPRLPPSAR